MISILLIYSLDVLSMKKISHVCFVEKYSYLFLVHLIAISCKIGRANIMYNTYI
jgi:hypothetical protein